MSFYYWDPVFTLDSLEDATLANNHVNSLYIRYFDIDWTPSDAAPVSLSPLSYAIPSVPYNIIPVVSIRDRVFEKIDSDSIPGFAANVFARVRSINASRRLRNEEIQFDCDWTGKTRGNYFSFLREYRKISVQSISAAIRMNQLRYPDRMGVPPVDHGVLFYFSLEETDTGDQRSVYERPIAHRFTPSLRSYPLMLDMALPIFAAGKDSRNGEGLFEIISDINRHSNHHIRNLIFFDLDHADLLRYDSNVFKEALARID